MSVAFQDEWFIRLNPIDGVGPIPSVEYKSYTVRHLLQEQSVINSVYPVPGGITLGRGKSDATKCDNGVIDCPIVSRNHAQLLTNCFGQVFIIDLGSHHGTYLTAISGPPQFPTSDGIHRLTPCRPIELFHNDILQLGKVVIDSTRGKFEPLRFRVQYRYPFFVESSVNRFPVNPPVAYPLVYFAAPKDAVTIKAEVDKGMRQKEQDYRKVDEAVKVLTVDGTPSENSRSEESQQSDRMSRHYIAEPSKARSIPSDGSKVYTKEELNTWHLPLLDVDDSIPESYGQLSDQEPRRNLIVGHSRLIPTYTISDELEYAERSGVYGIPQSVLYHSDEEPDFARDQASLSKTISIAPTRDPSEGPESRTSSISAKEEATTPTPIKIGTTKELADPSFMPFAEMYHDCTREQDGSVDQPNALVVIDQLGEIVCRGPYFPNMRDPPAPMPTPATATASEQVRVFCNLLSPSPHRSSSPEPPLAPIKHTGSVIEAGDVITAIRPESVEDDQVTRNDHGTFYSYSDDDESDEEFDFTKAAVDREREREMAVVRYDSVMPEDQDEEAYSSDTSYARDNSSDNEEGTEVSMDGKEEQSVCIEDVNEDDNMSDSRSYCSDERAIRDDTSELSSLADEEMEHDGEKMEEEVEHDQDSVEADYEDEEEEQEDDTEEEDGESDDHVEAEEDDDVCSHQDEQQKEDGEKEVDNDAVDRQWKMSMLKERVRMNLAVQAFERAKKKRIERSKAKEAVKLAGYQIEQEVSSIDQVSQESAQCGCYAGLPSLDGPSSAQFARPSRLNIGDSDIDVSDVSSALSMGLITPPACTTVSLPSTSSPNSIRKRLYAAVDDNEGVSDHDSMSTPMSNCEDLLVRRKRSKPTTTKSTIVVERPAKQRSMSSTIGLVILGAALGSAGTIAGLMQMAP